MKIRSKLLLCLIALALATFIVSQFYQNNFLVTGLLLIACVVIVVHSWNRKGELVPFAVAAIFGPTIEAIIIHFGAWSYANPTMFGIPIWLPLLWGFTGYFITKMASWVRM